VTVDAVIPALDEADSLGAVLDALPSPPVRRVVVADNGSTDGTARVAREHGATVVREPQRGYGAACLGADALAADP
jgi:glycosyltransferase involved in cell wall biosynthesis